MIVPDVNLLLYATIADFPEHEQARRWWEQTINDGMAVGLVSPVVFGFIRVATNPRIFDTPMEVDAALTCVEEWLAQPDVQYLLPGPRHLDIAFRLLRGLGSASNLTTDVQLAAIAIEYQSELHSADTDFARFSQLRWVNPLET